MRLEVPHALRGGESTAERTFTTLTRMIEVLRLSPVRWLMLVWSGPFARVRDGRSW